LKKHKSCPGCGNLTSYSFSHCPRCGMPLSACLVESRR
jgi:predicted amidophosphoribosyltransferase